MALITAALTALSAPVARAAAVCHGSWQVVPGPSERASWYFGDIAVTADEVWATGQYEGSGAVAHRSRGHWSVVNVEDALNLHAIAARPGAVWAVGTDAQTYENVVFTRRGSTWHRVDVPLEDGDGLGDIQLTSPSNVWIGGSTSLSGGMRRPLALHFDGVKWTRFVLPDEGIGYAIETLGPDDTWVAGATQDPDIDYLMNAAAWHWNGKRWALEKLGDSITDQSWFSRIVANRQGDVWAIGEALEVESASYGIVARWTPSGWLRVSLAGILDCGVHCQPLDALAGAESTVTVFGYAPLAPHTYNGGRWEPIIDTPGDGWNAADSDGQGNAWVIPTGFQDGTSMFLHRCA